VELIAATGAEIELFAAAPTRKLADAAERAGVAIERRACRIMLRYLNGYQPVRSLPRVFAKVTGVAVESRPWFSVGDVADCFVEISADNKRPNFALQDSCQNRAELRRKIESCDQSKDVT